MHSTCFPARAAGVRTVSCALRSGEFLTRGLSSPRAKYIAATCCSFVGLPRSISTNICRWSSNIMRLPSAICSGAWPLSSATACTPPHPPLSHRQHGIQNEIVRKQAVALRCVVLQCL